MTVAVVAGVVANRPHRGGAAWTRMSWVGALRELGFDVVFVEQVSPGDLREGCASIPWFVDVAARFGLDGRASLLVADETSSPRSVAGLSYAEVRDRCAEASLLLNISGNLRIRRLLDLIAHRAYVDLDPGYTQAWWAAGTAGADIDGHTHHFTVGRNVGRSGGGVPADGVQWIPVDQPVVLDDWPVAVTPPSRGFTTVATWRGPFGPLVVGGRSAGSKVHEFRRFVGVPSRVPGGIFELALDIDPADHRDRELLLDEGWRLVDAATAAGSIDGFRSYVGESLAEFSVAQGVYVELETGWFSDRSVRYLASGRPAVVQDTGFSAHLPVGEGLIAFRTPDEAVAGVRAVLDDPGRHARAARRLAEEHFRSEVALRPVLEHTGIGP